MMLLLHAVIVDDDVVIDVVFLRLILLGLVVTMTWPIGCQDKHV